MTALSALAFALSMYLSWHYLSGRSVIGCGGGSPCDQVLSSRWSSIAGVVPVSGLAAGVYLAFLVATFFIGPGTPAPDRRFAWGSLLLFAGAAAGAAIWFTVVQRWMVGAFCPYCMVTHVIGILLAALVFWRSLLQRNRAAENTAAPASPSPLIRPLPAVGSAIAGLAMAGILAGAQMATAPKEIGRAHV